MSLHLNSFRQIGLLIVGCLLSLTASHSTQAEVPSPAQSPADAVEGLRLGGEFSLSPELVPRRIMSQADPPKDLPERPQELPSEPPSVRPSEESSAKSSEEPVNESPEVAAESGPRLRIAEAVPRLESPSQQALDRPTSTLPPLSYAELEARQRVRDVLEAYRYWRLNSREHSPWEIMHAIIGHGVGAQLLQNGPHGRPITAVGWLCFNRPAGKRNQKLFYASKDGGFGTLQGPGLEGHRGQLLAVLAQAMVKPDYPIEVEGRRFTVEDLIEYEKRTCYPRTELTFKLIGLNCYLEQDAQWENDRGEPWDIPRLIREEISQPIRGVTCGGTHRLAGLSLAVKKRIASGKPLDGEYAVAARYLNAYHAYTFQLQNRDGSFSTQWFERRGADPDPGRRLQTTGHILEWLCYSLPSEDLRDPRLRAAADFLARLMWTHRNRKWDNGPLGHAVHALVLYDERVFQPHDEQSEQLSAVKKQQSEGGLSR